MVRWRFITSISGRAPRALSRSPVRVDAMTMPGTGGLKQWTALPRSFPMAVEGIEDRTDRPQRVAEMLESLRLAETNRVVGVPVVGVPTPSEEFLRLGRQKQAEKYLDTQLVAFRFEGEIEPDPSHAPITSFHPLREVVNAMEAELFSFRPDLIFGFLRAAFRRFPGRLPFHGQHDGPLNDDEYYAKIQNSIKTLVTEVAMAKPAEPFEWVARFLENAAEEEVAANRASAASVERKAATTDIQNMTPGEFRLFALELFKQFDTDKNGVLDPWELRDVLASSSLSLTPSEQREVLQEADLDDNGLVEYKEFVPLLHSLIVSVKSKHAARQARAEATTTARESAQIQFVKGMTIDELSATIRRVFQDCDLDGNGTLDPTEFRKALRSAELNLSKKEINLLLMQSDLNHDGVVEYDEFVPVCFDVLVERATHKQLESDATRSCDAVTKALLEVFASADLEDSGKLKLRQLKRCLQALVENDVLSLSKTQIISVLSTSDPSPDDGLVRYKRWAPLAADIIYGMLDFVAHTRRVKAIAHLSNTKTHDFESIRHFSTYQVEAILKDAFAAADANGDGVLDEDKTRIVLDSVGVTMLGLSHSQITGICAAADLNGDGMVDYDELASLVHDVVTQMSLEDAVRQRAFRNTAGDVKSRTDITKTKDDTMAARFASVSTDDTSHLKQDFDSGGRGALGKNRNQRSVKIRLGGDFRGYV